jgi:hypothetical protein
MAVRQLRGGIGWGFFHGRIRRGKLHAPGIYSIGCRLQSPDSKAGFGEDRVLKIAIKPVFSGISRRLARLLSFGPRSRLQMAVKTSITDHAPIRVTPENQEKVVLCSQM